MIARFLYLPFVLTTVLLTSCNTYPQNFTKLDIWKDRAERMLVQKYDSGGKATWKITKRVFYDVITLGIMETRYAQIKRNLRYYSNIYDECEFFDSFIGKRKSDLLLQFGAPHYVTDDGDGGKIFIWTRERIRGQSNMISGTTFSNHNAFSSGVTISNYYKEIMSRQFFVNAEGIVYLWKTSNPSIFGVMRDDLARLHYISSF